jgi:hypothetical protein
MLSSNGDVLTKVISVGDAGCTTKEELSQVAAAIAHTE